MWLESYLTETTANRTVVVTSHDQDFLDNVVEETVYIRKQQLRYFEGYVNLDINWCRAK